MNISSLAFCLGAAACSLAFATTPVTRQEAPAGYSFVANTVGTTPGSTGQFFTLQGPGGLNDNEVFRLSANAWQRVSPASSVQRRYFTVDTNQEGSRVLIAALDPALPVGGFVWDALLGLSQIETPSNITGYSPRGWSADGQVIVGSGVASGVGLSGNIRTASGQWRVNASTSFYGSPSPDGSLAFGSYFASDGRQWPAAWNLTNDTLAVAVPPRVGETPSGFSSLNRNHNLFAVATQSASGSRTFVYSAETTLYTPISGPSGYNIGFPTTSTSSGQLILGASSLAGGNLNNLFAWAWTPTTGSLLLQDYLARFGVDFSGWASLETARVSLDGLTFWGLGQYQTAPGQTSRQAWTVTIPTPSAAPALFAAGLLACRRRRR